MSAPFLGKPELYWCKACNTPLLEKKCSCGANPVEVPISPPGEVRPVFSADRARILEAAEKNMGTLSLPQLLFFNKLGWIDRMDELIAGGELVGVFRYDFETSCFELLPRVALYKYLSAPKRIFIPEGVVKFIEHGDLLVPGVSSCDAGISPGDWVFICTDKPVACGISLMGSAQLSAHGKGVAVKIKDFSKEFVPRPTSDPPLSEAVSKNAPALERLEREAVLRMRDFALSHSKPLSVSFSGGKDSLVVLLLAQLSGLDFSVIFADTGIEFPETIEFVKKVGKNFRFLSESAGDSFYATFPYFGAPARDFRWCCKNCKLGPLARLILSNFPDGCITFGGERRFESESRMRRGFEGSNPWVQNQLSFYPLYNWNSISVWFYLFWKKAEYNPLYELGYERIGCYPCPASSLADLALLREHHPALYEKLASSLQEYSRKNEFPEEFLKFGLWRWKQLNPAMEEFVRKKGIVLHPPRFSGRLSFRMLSGVSPCKSGGYSVECAFCRPLSLELVSALSRILGTIKYSPSLGILTVSRAGMEATVHSTGSVRVRGPSESSALVDFANLLGNLIIRAEECVGCGVCAASCPQHAIVISGRRAVVGDACNSCGACLPFCPVSKFGGGNKI